MAGKITRGMILAAGLGTRLRPLTLETPKPILDVGGMKMIEYAISLYKSYGIIEILINIHHLADKIRSFIGDGSRYGVKIIYSFEPEILGTGGGIKKALPFFGDEPFFVVNSDVILDVNLHDAADFHLEGGFDATLVVKSREGLDDYTPVRVEDGFLKEFGRGDKIYTGLQIIDPSVLDLLPDDAFSDIVRDGYMKLLDKDCPIGAYLYDGFWLDIGTMDNLKAARNLFENSKVRLSYL